MSYALNGKPGVGPALRARIEEHAREVGWTPHSGARALRQGHSGNVGLVMVRDPQERSREPFYAAVTAGIESATSARERELLIRFVEGGAPEEIDVFRAWSQQRRVDGVVLLDMQVDDPRPTELASLGMPFSVLGAYTGSEDFVNVLRSETDDARTVLEHLQGCGYDGVIQLVGPTAFQHERRRLDLIGALCSERGLPPRTCRVRTRSSSGAKRSLGRRSRSVRALRSSHRATSSRSARSEQPVPAAWRSPRIWGWSAGTIP